jgi:hypothetical protein
MFDTVHSDEVIKKWLIGCCGKSFKDLRPVANSLQPLLNEAALRIVKDNVDVKYVDEVLQSVEKSKQHLHQPLPDEESELSELSQDRDVYTIYRRRTPDELELYLSPRDKSIRDISRRIYRHRRANRRERSAHFIPKPIVSLEDDQTWKYWLGEIASEFQGAARRHEVAEHLHQIKIAVLREAYEENDSPIELNWPDHEGETLLHAFISLIDSRTMDSNNVQETLGTILSCSGDAIHRRNKHGETPLHLAAKLALPHVVATLLRHLVKHGLVSDEGSIASLREVIEVSDNDGTSLLTNLHLTYWLARRSDEPEALHFEVDALICVRIIVNAMVGHLPAETHEFRQFRTATEFTKRRDIASKRLRSQHKRTSLVPSKVDKGYKPIAPVGTHLQRQKDVGVLQEASQNLTTAAHMPLGSAMPFQQYNSTSYHGANYITTSDPVSKRYHYQRHLIC